MSILTNFDKKARLKMQIKCENCSIVYEVSENHLMVRHPRFLKCTSCGHVFHAPVLSEVEHENSSIPPVEQTDSVPMSLSEIFQTPSSSYSESEVYSDISSEQEESIQTEVQPVTKVAPTADLFAPFDSADEFMPVSERKNPQKTKRLFIALSFITLLSFALIYLLYVGRYFFVRQAGVPPVFYQKAGIETKITGDGLAFQNSVFNVIDNQKKYLLSIKSEIINTTDSILKLPKVVIYLKDDKGATVQKTNPTLGKDRLSAGETLPFETQIYPIVSSARSIEITFEKES